MSNFNCPSCNKYCGGGLLFCDVCKSTLCWGCLRACSVHRIFICRKCIDSHDCATTKPCAICGRENHRRECDRMENDKLLIKCDTCNCFVCYKCEEMCVFCSESVCKKCNNEHYSIHQREWLVAQHDKTEIFFSLFKVKWPTLLNHEWSFCYSWYPG